MTETPKTTVRDARTGEHIPARPEWLWYPEWVNMIFGSRETWRRICREAIRVQEALKRA